MSSAAKGIVLGSTRSSNKALYISIGLGILAALANLLYASRVQGSRVDVLKARAKITAGTRVDPSLFTRVSIYGDDLKETRALLVQQKDLESYSQIPLAETVEPGQVLFQSSFQFAGNRGIRDAIRPDQRAIALAVKEEMNAVAYFVRPGDTVDVWVSIGPETENIIPGAIVRAVGDASVAAGDNGGREFRYRSVTVIVPAEGLGEILHKLSLAKNEVTLALAGSAGASSKPE
jgi:Flp pilus assembly protein CpaB